MCWKNDRLEKKHFWIKTLWYKTFWKNDSPKYQSGPTNPWNRPFNNIRFASFRRTLYKVVGCKVNLLWSTCFYLVQFTEAIQAVITYTDDALQLLKRKKLKRDHIFRYLANHGVAVSPNAEKSKLIRAVLTYWDTNINQAVLQNVSIDASNCHFAVQVVQKKGKKKKKKHE